MRLKTTLRLTASCAVLMGFVAAGAAQAQDDVPEIIVTAQKREQNLQDVPVVVTTISEQALQGAGVRDIKDLQVLTPGLTVTSTSNETMTTARIRGVGTVGDNPGLESSVGVVIDGVYRPRNGVGFGDLGEMQRIEILKGPQGTLFGKNTSAGVINIVTKAPSFVPGLIGEATVGNFGAVGGSVSMTGPLIEDRLAGRLYVAARQRDGFYDVRTGGGPRTDTDDANQNFKTIRGQLLFVPSDEVELRLIADWSERNERCCVAVQTRTGPTAAMVTGFGGAVANPARPFDRIAYANRPTDQDVTDKGVSLEANVDLDHWNATLTSVTSMRMWDTANAQDTDFTTADIWYRNKDENTVSFETFSQELRLAGQTGRLNWLVGGFFANEDLQRRDRIRVGSAYEPYFSTLIVNNLWSLINRPQAQGGFGAAGQVPGTFTANGHLFASQATGLPFGSGYPANTGYTDTYNQNSKSYALFTNNSFAVTDQLELTLGLRYTVEEKRLFTNYRNDSVVGTCGAMLANQGPIANALIARGVPAAWFAPGDPRGPTLVQVTVGTACLTGTNPLFHNLNTAQEQTEKEWSGTAKAAYRWNPNVMTYASFARGYKGGGFNLDRTQTGVTPTLDTSFDPEFVDSYEVGAKTTWFNGSLLINATYFHQTFSDFQLNTFLGTTFVVESIPEVVSKGVDADFFWFTPVSGLSFQGGVTYADTKYSQFTAADLAPGRFVPLSLLPGQRMSFAPEWSGSLAMNFDREIGANLRGLFNLSAKYVSEYNTGSDLLPAKMQDSFTLLNGRVGVGSADERWTLEFWGLNLTDEDYYQVVFNAPLQGSAFPVAQPAYIPANDSQTYNAFLGAPRTYGVTLRVKF